MDWKTIYIIVYGNEIDWDMCNVTVIKGQLLWYMLNYLPEAISSASDSIKSMDSNGTLIAFIMRMQNHVTAN